MTPIPSKSLAGSYWSLDLSAGLTVNVVFDEINNAYPSAGLLATAAAPIAVPAPALFSTSTF